MLNIKNDDATKQRFFTNAIFVLVFLLLCRIIASYFIPLNDTTEARYGEIARKMLETGDWITLQHDYGIPFWAKPPLSVWFNALSMKFFGVNEFAARLPALLLSMGILWLVWDLAKKQSGSIVATLSTIILASNFYFFLDAGAVMTDPALLFCTTLAIVSFWHAIVNNNKTWSYVFFVALGLGMLAKGPIAMVLVGTPLFFWILLRNEWRNLWKKLPLIKGSLLFLVITLPWYIGAELKTPGFLNYFIVGEHLNRFLIPSWEGDKYGLAHHEPKGMIWLYAVAGIFPWSIVIGFWLLKYGKTFLSLYKDEKGWMSYLFLCTITPLLFFTFASNIIYPYVFPSLPAFALLLAETWNRLNYSLTHSTWILKLSMICGVFFLIATVVFQISPELVAKTQKPVVAAWKEQHPTPGSHLIYWDLGKWFSAQFYSAGVVKATRDLQELCRLLSNQMDNYLVINAKDVEQIPAELFAKFTPAKTILYKENKILLMHCPVLTCKS